MKKAEEEYFDLMEANRKGEKGKDDKIKVDNAPISTTLNMLRDVRNQWIEAENYRFLRSRRRID